MRRLIERLCHEAKGGVSVMVALLLVVLLGAAALAVDAGVMYAERAELQNGADAAALAIAQDCADGTCVNTASTAEQYANRNAKDNASDVADVQLAPSSVTVDVISRNGATGAPSLSLFFAPVLGIDGTTVGATATAGWNTFPESGTAVLPLAFSTCTFNAASTGGIRLFQTHGNGMPAPCGSGTPPGAFQWLDDPLGNCSAFVTIADDQPAQAGSDPGNDISQACKDLLPTLVGKTVLLPVYEGVAGSGQAATYDIKGWAGFILRGWRFPGSQYPPTPIPGTECPGPGSCKGLIGEFVDFGSLGDGFTETTDPNADLGASIVTLTK
ncbi:pilus assembly protein TadG-related protein [Kocuria turfanensis]|uniref:pilus assembly protein TadG-related protein n=1 Tax=Kocuria turfanensis TaxID=388357 RepID=UPI004035BF3B